MSRSFCAVFLSSLSFSSTFVTITFWPNQFGFLLVRWLCLDTLLLVSSGDCFSSVVSTFCLVVVSCHIEFSSSSDELSISSVVSGGFFFSGSPANDFFGRACFLVVFGLVFLSSFFFIKVFSGLFNSISSLSSAFLRAAIFRSSEWLFPPLFFWVLVLGLCDMLFCFATSLFAIT